MKSNFGRSWSIILGGLIGFTLGVIFPYAIIDVEGYWKPQPYEAVKPSADRAVELVGYNYQDELLYVKGQSHAIMGITIGVTIGSMIPRMARRVSKNLPQH